MKPETKALLKKVWRFIWEDDSILSWIVNIVLAFVLIKFIVYPGLGFVLQTTHPVVAVVSESMEHRTVSVCAEKINPKIDRSFLNCKKHKYALCGKLYDINQKVDFDFFWKDCGSWYEGENIGITAENFKKFELKNGFNKGDIMVLRGKKSEALNVGDVIVFRSKKPDPIIHRVIRKWKDENGQYFYHTKGDHNKASIKDSIIDETNIDESQVIGKAVLRVPLLGYIKIGFNELICYNPMRHVLSNFFALSC